ncbi:MAG: hypothetical protein GX464_08070, partial [Holophagae bacterium]|nr:hypothetical protein [Holophagae bacterium]
GGGGNGGSGGKGGNAWSAPAEVTGGHGGAAFPVGTYAGARVVMGGGGGSAPANNNNSNDYPHGAAGGGIILIRARQITIPSNSSLTLSANGGTAPRSTQDGGGGGGAGGTVLCATCTVGALTRLTASATGGAGADTLWPTGNGTPDMHGPGGGGGGGVVLLSGAPASTTVTGGAAGHARSGNADGGVYGATAGSAGVSSTSTDVLASPGADPGCGCVPTAVVVSSFEALAASRGAVVEWETASEAGTAGFVLERQDGSAGWREVHTGLLPALPEVAQGGTYRLVDETAPAASDSPLVYRLTEVERSGRTLEYGPFEVAVDWSHAAVETTESFSSRSHPLVAAPAIERIATEGRIRKPQALKLGVREAGIYELSAAAIASGLGETLESVRSMIRTGQVRITNLGTPIAWEAGEAAHGVRFFGVPPESVYTAENIYWLWPRQAGTVMESFDGGSPEPASQDQTYTDTLHVEKNLFAGLTTALSTEADYWYWEMVASGDPKLGSKTVTFDVPGVASSRSAATLVVNLYGASETGVEGEHGAAVSLNGQPLGTARWQGIGAYRMKLAIPAGALHRGLNSLTVTGVKGNGVPFDYFYLNSLDLTYRRLYDGGGAPLTVVGDGNRVITVRGFSDSQLLGYDITAPAGPRVLTRGTITADGTAYSLSFVPASVARRYLVLSTSAVRAPRIEPWNPPIQPLGAPGRLPSHLIIAPRVLADAAEELALYHRSQGLDARLIEAEQIYDELTFGLVTPRAIEALLSRVDAGSARRPRSVVLVGSGTYDYKDYLGLGGNLLPPLMIRTEAGLVAADSELVLGTDTVIGRVPAQSPTEVEGYLRKLAAYESARPGEWQEAVTILADNPDKGGDFDVDADRLAALVPPPYSAQKLYLGPLPLPSLRRDLLAGLAEGRFLVAFVGHAGVDRLAAEGILTSADVPALAATDALPVVTAFSCHVGRFDLAGFRCLGDHLVTNDGRGAVAVFAPAGLNYNTQSLGLGEAVFNAVFAASSRRRDVRLAEILREAIASHAAAGGSTTTSRGYNLLGDPAVRLKRGE